MQPVHPKRFAQFMVIFPIILACLNQNCGRFWGGFLGSSFTVTAATGALPGPPGIRSKKGPEPSLTQPYKEIAPGGRQAVSR
jgi:hypothetical protein